jgi:hypothetical protein
LLRVEQDKVLRYSKGYASEGKIAEFYADHATSRLAEVQEVLESYAFNAGLSFDVQTEARSILNRHIERSVTESKDISTVNSWLGSRADEFATIEIARLGGIQRGNLCMSRS